MSDEYGRHWDRCPKCGGIGICEDVTTCIECGFDAEKLYFITKVVPDGINPITGTISEKLEKRPRIIMKNLEFEECCQCGENVVCAEFKYCPMCGVTVCPSCGDLSYDNIMYKCCNKNCRE